MTAGRPLRFRFCSWAYVIHRNAVWLSLFVVVVLFTIAAPLAQVPPTTTPQEPTLTTPATTVPDRTEPLKDATPGRDAQIEELMRALVRLPLAAGHA